MAFVLLVIGLESHRIKKVGHGSLIGSYQIGNLNNNIKTKLGKKESIVLVR